MDNKVRQKGDLIKAAKEYLQFVELHKEAFTQKAYDAFIGLKQEQDSVLRAIYQQFADVQHGGIEVESESFPSQLKADLQKTKVEVASLSRIGGWEEKSDKPKKVLDNLSARAKNDEVAQKEGLLEKMRLKEQGFLKALENFKSADIQKSSLGGKSVSDYRGLARFSDSQSDSVLASLAFSSSKVLSDLVVGQKSAAKAKPAFNLSTKTTPVQRVGSIFRERKPHLPREEGGGDNYSAKEKRVTGKSPYADPLPQPKQYVPQNSVRNTAGVSKVREQDVQNRYGNSPYSK